LVLETKERCGDYRPVVSKNAVANLVIGSQEPGDNFDILRTKVVVKSKFRFLYSNVGLEIIKFLALGKSS